MKNRAIFLPICLVALLLVGFFSKNVGFASNFDGENRNAQNEEVESDSNDETKDIREIAFNQLSEEQRALITS